MPEEWVVVVSEFKSHLEDFQNAGVTLDAAILAFFLKRQDETFQGILSKLDEVITAIEESGPPGPA